MKRKLELIKRNVAEIVTEKEMISMLKSRKQVSVYCGYEPSGPIHLGHMVTLQKLKDLQDAGMKVKVLLADMHAYLNKKGDWKFIEKEVGQWSKSIKALGLKAEVIKGSSFQYRKDYWEDIIQMSLRTTINRGLRSMQEVARDVKNAAVSQILYPLMQAEDIKQLKVDISLGGLEQRKIHMLARELLPGVGYKSPTCLHTPLITSLKGPGSKMSKSIPGSGISIVDADSEITRSIRKAYCPEKIVKDNPVLQIIWLIVFPQVKSFKVERPAKFGGDVEFKNFAELESSYSTGKLHPMDLKNAVAKYLIKIIAPIRKKI